MAMKEIFDVKDNFFVFMIVVDVVVVNIWMGFLFYGASILDKLDCCFKVDNSVIIDFKQCVFDYQVSVVKIFFIMEIFVLFVVSFGGVVLVYWGVDVIVFWVS